MLPSILQGSFRDVVSEEKRACVRGRSGLQLITNRFYTHEYGGFQAYL